MATYERVIYLFALAVISSIAASEVNIGKAMEEHQVVPDVIDQAPEKEIEVNRHEI